MKKVNYDPEADALSFNLTSRKSDMTIELTEHILFDLTTEGKPVSLEILDASDEISKLFNRIVTKEEIKQLLCDIVPEPRNEYLIRFKSPQKNEIASFLIPIYKSPIL